MNSEQLQDWLTDLSERFKNNPEKHALKDVEHERMLLTHETGKTHYLIGYLSCNYNDIDLAQPVVAQLLSCYYRGGVLRYFAIQCIPSLIHMYLLALVKRQKKSVSMFETFFLAIYNEEILAGGSNSESTVKKVEEVRIPSTRFPSVYHDPKKLNLTSDVVVLKSGTPAFVQMTVRIGPYKSLDRITPENRQTVLTRLLKTVNACLCRLSRDVICRYICLSTIALCQSGFSFPESDLKSRMFENDFCSEISDDFSKKPRLRISSQYLLESLNGLYFALFNGAPELAVQAVDAVHQRALYELYADVVLVTNSIRETLLESSFHKNEEFFTTTRTSSGRLDGRRGSEIVTNSSLRLKKMPEDIAPVVDDENKGSHFTDSVENFKKRIAMKMEQHKFMHHFGHHRRKSEGNLENMEEIELDPISEEKSVTVNAIIDQLASETALDNSLRLNSSLLETTNSNNSASAPHLENRVQNGSAQMSKSDALIEFSTLKSDDFAETLKESGKQDLAKRLSNIRHVDSIGDPFENPSI